MKKIPTFHRLEPGQDITIEIFAEQKFSQERISVIENEQYQFTCAPDQVWTDWTKESSPDGFDNKLAKFFGTRVAGTKCFCLCGSYNVSKKHCFAIGSEKIVEIATSGDLSFFANDTWWAYWNNKGSVLVRSTRIK